MHVRDHIRKFSAACSMELKHSQRVALHLGGFIGMFGVPGILQCDNGTEFKGACDHLVHHHGMPVVHSKPRTPQTNGLIEQANGVLKTKILAWMTEMQSTEWWLALPDAMLSMNRQVHSTTGKSPYEVVFKQLMPDHPQIFAAQQSTAIVLEHLESLDTITPSIDPQLHAISTNSVDSRNQSTSVEEKQAIQSLN